MKKILLGMALACFGSGFTSNAQIVMSQNFEGVTVPALPASWTNATTGGGAGWVTNSGAYNWPLQSITPHTKYCLVDDAGTFYNNPSYLTSPTFSLVGVTSPYLAYDWYYLKAWLNTTTDVAVPYPHEAAWVEISTDGGGVWNFIDSVPGFSSSVTDWATQFVNLGSVTPTANCVLRFCYTDRGGKTGTSPSGIIGCAIDNIIVYGASVPDLGITTVTPVAGSAADYFVVGSGATFSGTVLNYSTSSLASYTAYYQVGSGTPVSQVISTAVPAMSTGSFSISPAYTVASASQLPVKVWVKATSDANVTNDSANTAVIGVSFMPKKRLFFEEATGAWCGWCVRGIVYMDSLWRADSNSVNIVSVHNNDSMMRNNTSATKYDAFIGGFIGGYPDMVVDRRETIDPSGCFSIYGAENSMFGFAEMGLKYTTTGGNINATVRVKPALDLTGDYRIEMIVTEDEVTYGSAGTGPGNGWKQHNYYAPGGPGNSTPMKTLGYDFNTLPADITNIKYPFVARTTLPADLSTTPNGIAGSLPSSMTANTVYTYTVPAIAIQSGYKGWNAAKLRVIALLIDANPSSPSYGNVLNSISSKGLYLGVSDVNAGVQNMIVYPNPATSDAHIKFELDNATKVTCSVYDMMGRVVFTTPAEDMNIGGHEVNFSTSNIAAGVYNVVIRTENGTLSQRLSIAK